MSYLSNIDLHRILPELELATALSEHPFSKDQVRVCSIDLRCDRIFWVQRRFSGTLDLTSTALMETAPRRHWARRELQIGRSIKVRPGEMILGRTYERFRIPSTHAGKITGRSSYARLGIEVSCTCDLINPGWEGHVPLEIVNNSNHAIMIHPLLPLAQIFLIPLSSPASPEYSDRARFKSKYINDDGGPSYWWRDAMVQRLYQDYLGHRVDQAAIERLNLQVGKLDDNGVFRLEKFMKKTRLGEITNVDDLLASFIESEKRGKLIFQAVQWFPRLFMAVLLPATLGVIYYTDKLTKIHWVLFGATFVTGVWALTAWIITKGDEPKFLTSEQ